MNKLFAVLLLAMGVSLVDVSAVRAKEKASEAAVPKAALNATLSEKQGGKAAASFGAGQPVIYLNYQDAGLNKGDKIRAVWTLEDGGKTVVPNTKVSESTAAAVGPRSKGGFFQLNKPAAGWPLGKYRVELHVGEALVQTLKFSIR